MAFASPNDFITRFDARTIGELAQDVGVPLTPAQILSDTNTQTCLDDAAGEIVLALVSNQHYAEQDLVNIANSGTYSGSALKRLNCVIALGNMFGRHIYNDDEVTQRIPGWKWAQDLIEQLKNGQRVFELPVANVRAGVMATTPLGKSIPPCGLVGHNRRVYGSTPVNFGDTGNF